MREVFIQNYEGQKGKDALHLKGGEDMIVSDGYHSFDELYDTRCTLYIELCRAQKKIEMVYDRKAYAMFIREVWRSKLHSDGTKYDGYFILGINKKEGLQITFHIPLSRWKETDFAETLPKAPEFDGHSPADVLARLKVL